MNFLGILTAIFFSISIFFSFFCINVLFPEQQQSSKYKIIQWKLSSRETPARINPILIAIALKIPCLHSMVPINLLWTVDVGLLGFKAVLIRKRWMQVYVIHSELGLRKEGLPYAELYIKGVVRYLMICLLSPYYIILLESILQNS